LETDDNRDNGSVTMVTKLVSNDNNNSFKLPSSYTSSRYKIYDDINKTGKKEKDLY
jgi:hypothetical protein